MRHSFFADINNLSDARSAREGHSGKQKRCRADCLPQNVSKTYQGMNIWDTNWFLLNKFSIAPPISVRRFGVCVICSANSRTHVKLIGYHYVVQQCESDPAYPADHFCRGASTKFLARRCQPSMTRTTFIPNL